MKNVIVISSEEPYISMYSSLLLFVETFGITNMQILKVLKKLFQRWLVHGFHPLISKWKMRNNNWRFIKCLLNVIENFIHRKTQKFDYETPDWMNSYCSIINRFLNNKKIPIISPVFFEGKLISDLEKKIEPFNNHFASQWFLVKNASTLTNLGYKTDRSLNYLEINQNDKFDFLNKS